MNKLVAVPVLLAGVSALAATPTIVNTLSFDTCGCDCYAEVDEEGWNVPVHEGECYALVWQSNSVTEFPGLPKNPPNPKNPAVNGIWVAHYFPVATDMGDGWMACPKVSIDKLTKQDNANGKWTVYLLDTRYLDENGQEAWGFDEAVTNAPRCINAYTPIANLQNFTIGESPARPDGSSMNTTELSGGDLEADMVADQEAVLPADWPTPIVSSIAVGNENVTLAVTNTAPYLAYDLVTTDDVKTIRTSGNFVGDIKQGVGAGPLTWTVPVGAEKRGFFKVLPRKPDFGSRMLEH